MSLLEVESERIADAIETWTFGQACRALLDFIDDIDPGRPLTLHRHHLLESLLQVFDGTLKRALLAGVSPDSLAGLIAARSDLESQMSRRWTPGLYDEVLKVLTFEILMATYPTG